MKCKIITYVGQRKKKWNLKKPWKGVVNGCFVNCIFYTSVANPVDSGEGGGGRGRALPL